MANSNIYKSQQIRHKILLEGQKERISLLILKFLTEANTDIISRLNPKNKDKSLKVISSYTDEVFKDLKKLIINETKRLAIYETNFQAEMIKIYGAGYIKNTSNIAGISDDLILEIINNRSIRGLVLDEFLLKQKIVLTTNLRSTFDIAITEGISTDKIAQRITQNVLNVNTRQATVIARTAVTNTLNGAKQETYKKNNVEKYQYVAILDSKTTDICRKLDGKVYFVNDKTAPVPPQHLQCRSSTIPIFADDFVIKENFSEWSSRQKDKDIIKDEYGNFKQNKKEITSLDKMKEKEKEILDNVNE